MKLNVWIEVSLWNVGNDGEFRQDNLPFVSTTPFTGNCPDNIKRFMTTLEIPFKSEPTIAIEPGRVEEVK